MSSQQESNLHLKFRKFLFYPLNYGTLVLFQIYNPATHFPFFSSPTNHKSNPVVTIDHILFKSLLETLGNAYSIR